MAALRRNPRRKFTRTKSELQRELARNRALEKKYAKQREEAARVARSQERADKKLAGRRQREADRIREGLKAKARVKLLRPYVEGFEADDGFNLREAGEWDAKQRRKIAKVYDKLAPFVLKPHVKVAARSKRQRAALTEFTGMAKPPKGLKAVPVVTPSPDHTKVTVTDDGVVQVRAGRMIQRHFFIPEQMQDIPSVELIARKMLRSMPAGFYFIKTGEHEAYNFRVEHDPREPIRDNLLYREVRRFVSFYGSERVANFFRGFRWIATLGDVAAAERESEKFIQARREMDADRAARRRDISTTARRRARRNVKG
ncbi:MAG: hypothetical protein AB7P97_20290 [Hyphomonadaceae bacterium]